VGARPPTDSSSCGRTTGERWNLACFLAQQAPEKALKSFLYASGAEAVWGHSVAELCHDAGARDADFQRLGKDTAALDQYWAVR
jgi:HEPN domain-containing protein